MGDPGAQVPLAQGGPGGVWVRMAHDPHDPGPHADADATCNSAVIDPVVLRCLGGNPDVALPLWVGYRLDAKGKVQGGIDGLNPLPYIELRKRLYEHNPATTINHLIPVESWEALDELAFATGEREAFARRFSAEMQVAGNMGDRSEARELADPLVILDRVMRNSTQRGNYELAIQALVMRRELFASRLKYTECRVKAQAAIEPMGIPRIFLLDVASSMLGPAGRDDFLAQLEQRGDDGEN